MYPSINSNNLFNALFNVDKGYISSDILSLNEINFTEKYDANKLIFILNNLDEIGKLFRPDARNKVSLEKYYKASKERKYNNILKVKYFQNNNGLFGRYQAVNGLSAQGMIREVRHTIFNDFYIDLDINNCHPVITKWLCDNLNIECQYLNEYVYNREKQIQDLIKLNPECNREYFKNAFLRVSYGCTDSTFKNLIKMKSEFIIKFRNEILYLQKEISERLYKFLDINTKIRIEKNKDYNYYGSTLSNICQFVENQLLLIIINYLKEKIKPEQLKYSILCFDGIMLLKDSFKKEYLTDLEQIFNNIGINIKLSIKEMKPLNLEVLGYNEQEKYTFTTNTYKELDIYKKYQCLFNVKCTDISFSKCFLSNFNNYIIFENKVFKFNNHFW